MPLRTRLRNTQSLDDFRKRLYIPDLDQRGRDKRETTWIEKWLDRLQQDLPIGPASQNPFGTHTTTRWIQALRRTERELLETLYAVNADIFAGGLAQVLGVEWLAGVRPIDLVPPAPPFVSPQKLPWANEETDGLPILRDWLTEQVGRFQWMADFSDWYDDQEVPSSTLFIVLEGAENNAADQRSQALVKAFGVNVLPLRQDASRGVDRGPEPYCVWSVHAMPDYLRRRMTAHGLRRSDFNLR